MCADPPVRVRELCPGVYLARFPGPGDVVLVDRTRAGPRWLACADVVVEPRAGADPERLVRLAALAYWLRLRAARGPTRGPRHGPA